MKKKVLITLLAAAIAGGGYYYWNTQKNAGEKIHYLTETVKRGNIRKTVNEESSGSSVLFIAGVEICINNIRQNIFAKPFPIIQMVN